MAQKRLGSLPEFFIGKIPLNLFDHSQTIEESKIQWLALVKKYLEEGQIENAKAIMRFHLEYKETVIDTIVKSSQPKEMDKTPKISSPTISSKPSSKLIVPITQNERPTQILPVYTQTNKKQTLSISKDEKRVELIWSSFNQKKLLALFKEKDCMKLLFEIPTNTFSCLFSRCMMDKTKFMTLRKFFKENGRIIANEFELHRLNEANLGFTVDQENGKKDKLPLITYLYQNKLESILHVLLEKFSIAKRLAFMTDVCLQSASSVVYLTNDYKIQGLMTFKDDTILENWKEIVDLLCQSTRYQPETSYAYHLCDSQGAALLVTLIGVPKLHQFISKNLYKIPENKDSSFFYKFTLTEMGIDILNCLYELDTSLLEQVTIEDLLKKCPSDDLPVFYGLCKRHEPGLSLLNDLITPELAAKIPHGLPDIHTLFFLGCTQNGTQIIERMMHAQPEMITKMTGEIVSQWPQTDEISIFSLLSYTNPAILNRLFDFHGKKFIEELTEAALFHSVYEMEYRSAYEYLQMSGEGKRFLKKMISSGWEMPFNQTSRIILKQADKYFPLPDKLSFFATSKENHCLSKPYKPKPVEILLWYLNTENEPQIRKMVRSEPRLLLQKGNLTDTKGNHFDDISPIEYLQRTKKNKLREIVMQTLNTDKEETEDLSLLSQDEFLCENQKFYF
ncbi:MAG: hypothetical protein H0U57_08055 [Tatlockia sp.]|nr:hypothetical protein [Tatlockia sp.]